MLWLGNAISSADALQFARGKVFALTIGATYLSADFLVGGDRIEDTP
jgi:hypothetical protein